MAEKQRRNELMNILIRGSLSDVERLVGMGFDFNADLDGHNNTALHVAVACKRVNVAKYLLENRKVDVNKLNNRGQSALYTAALSNNLEMIKLLVESGADVKISPSCTLSADKGHLKAIQDLRELKKGANNTFKFGSVLHLVAGVPGSLEVCKLMVNRGADINAVNDFNHLPIHAAANFKNIEVVKYMIKLKGLKLKQCSVDGSNLLHVVSERCDVETVRLVMAKGANWKAVDKLGHNMLHVAARGGNRDVVKYWIETDKFDVNSRNQDGESPLHLACMEHGNLATVKLLVDSGADFNALDKNDMLPLHQAVRENHMEIVRYFILEKGMSVSNCVGSKGPYLLQFSTSKGNLELFKFLIEHGADYRAEDEEGGLPIHFAMVAGQVNIIKYILDNNMVDLNHCAKDGSNLLHVATGGSYLEVVKLLVEGGVDCYALDSRGNSHLHIAAMSGGSLGIVGYLIDTLKLDVNKANKKKVTPLLYAAEHSKLDVVRLLIDRGADINAVDAKENSALSLAASNGQLQTAKYLVNEKKMNVNHRNKFGYTPMHEAARFGDLDFFKFLISKGGDYNAITEDGSNCWDFAWTSLRMNIVNFLSDEKKCESSRMGRLMDMCPRKLAKKCEFPPEMNGLLGALGLPQTMAEWYSDDSDDECCA